MNNETSTTVMQDPQTMALLWRRTWKLVAIMVPFAVLSSLLIYTAMIKPKTRPIAQLIPRLIDNTANGGGLWTAGPDEKLQPYEMAILENPQYILRTYADLSAHIPIFFCVVFSDDNRKGIHPPDVCLQGGGSHIELAQLHSVDIPAESPIAKSPARLVMKELITTDGGGMTYFSYVYKCGDRFTASFYQQQFWVVWNGFANRDASGALIRFSIPMRDRSDLANARARVDRLLCDMYPHILKLGSRVGAEANR